MKRSPGEPFAVSIPDRHRELSAMLAPDGVTDLLIALAEEG